MRPTIRGTMSNGNDPLAALLIAVDVERDAELHHRPVGRPLAAGQVVGRNVCGCGRKSGWQSARGCAVAVEHFVVEAVAIWYCENEIPPWL